MSTDPPTPVIAISRSKVKPGAPREKKKTFWVTPISLSLGAAAPNGRNLFVRGTMTGAAGHSGKTLVFTVIISTQTNALI